MCNYLHFCFTCINVHRFIGTCHNCARAHIRILICIYVFRLKESDKKTVFSVLKKSERDKKKLLETVLKQLRQLAQTTQQQ